MFYLTREQLPFFLPLGFIGVYRWFWFLIRLLAFALYKPLQPRRHPRFKSHRDVTIVVPTIDSGDEIKLALRSWLANDPFEVIFVTIPKAKPAIDELVRGVDPNGKRIRVVTVPKGNKRNQMVKGINHCRTDILVFCDDDVIWPPTMLKWILAPFEDKQMGGVGTSQTVMPLGKSWTIWEILSAFRISMRNIEITATTYIDGGVCCLSGRTAAYRTSILRTQEFQQAFTHEFWVGKYHQHSGDDKFLTRWMHSHDWKTYIQSCPEAELKSTFKDNWRFLLQLLRWTRNTWRSDIRSLFLERKVWTRHPFVAFSMLDKMINPFTLLLGPAMLIYLCTKPQIIPLWVVLTSYFAWLILTRLLKYMPHFVKRPQDILALPVWIVFNIYFAIMKLYCLFTLHVTGWGTRVGAGEEAEEGEGDGGLFEPHWNDEVPGHPYPPLDDRERERERRAHGHSKAGVVRERSVSIYVDGQRVGAGGGVPEVVVPMGPVVPAPAPIAQSAGILIATRVPGPSPTPGSYAPVRGDRPGSVDLSVMTGYTDDEDDAESQSTRWSGMDSSRWSAMDSARWSGSQGIGKVKKGQP